MDPALIDGLNPEQARAVQTLDGPLLILAGAGSGKTRVLTRRVAALMQRGTIGRDGPWLRPWNILAVTFTNKAAGEMRARVEKLVGESARQVWVGTFHATCVRILRRDIEPLGWRRDFVIYDDEDQLRVIKEAMKELKIDPQMLSATAIRARLDRRKNGIERPETVQNRADPLPKLHQLYDMRLKRANALDFNDLINKVVELWEHHPDVLAWWQDRFRYVLVDEYQDTNPAQYRLISLLVARDRNLAVVGDDDQSIYSFRGADIRNILDFEKEFPEAAVIRLERNYRSTGNILRAASGVVKHNLERKDKTLWTDAPPGDRIRLEFAQDETEEAEHVADEVQRLVRAGRTPGDMAVIYRTNAQSRPFEQAFVARRIPHVLVGGRKFYERMEVKDILAYLRLCVNRDDDVAFARVVNVPTRGVGEKALATLQATASAHGISLREGARRAPGSGRAGNALAAFTLMMDRFEQALQTFQPAELVMYIAAQSGYLEWLEREDTDEARGRIENIEQLATAAATAVEGTTGVERVQAFLDLATLSAQADSLPDEGGGAVTLLTAHLAKGLEYPVVFLVGMVEKCFPHARSQMEAEIEEERRLAYVAITRAKERLYVSAPLRRRAPEGWWSDSIMSRFLKEIPEEVVARASRTWQPSSASWAARPEPAPRRPAAPPRPAPPPARSPPPPRPAVRTISPETLDSFREGMEVLHPTLGLGTISRREGAPSNPRLTIHFTAHGPRTVYAASAGLEIIQR